MKDRSKTILFSIVVGFLMVTSVVGIVLVNYTGSSTGSLYYRGFRFDRTGTGLVADIRGMQIPFTYFPSEIEELRLNSSLVGRINSTRMVLVTSDFNSSIAGAVAAAQFDLRKALGESSGIFVVQGFTTNASSLPVITCANATAYVPVISFEQGNRTLFYERGNCIIAEAETPLDVLRARDRLLYGFFGVMDGS
ncbi:hypothetical protein HYY72_01170 [Candidatus Woesearchaeota archaeon]|nr:hypothetical protein [Candidatus Woesearchaeota archaeon]